MKELYLAKDWNNAVFGFDNIPINKNHTWMPSEGKIYSRAMLLKLGIDITKFPIQHETPIKIRAVWEVVE